jgi:hypothetical protein
MSRRHKPAAEEHDHRDGAAARGEGEIALS